MILEIILAVSLVLNLFLVFLLIRFSRRLLQFDELFQMLVGDLEFNIQFFHKLLTTPLFENSNEYSG